MAEAVESPGRDGLVCCGVYFAVGLAVQLQLVQEEDVDRDILDFKIASCVDLVEDFVIEGLQHIRRRTGWLVIGRFRKRGTFSHGLARQDKDFAKCECNRGALGR